MTEYTETEVAYTPKEEELQTDAEHLFVTAETESIDSGKIPIVQQLSLLAALLFLLLGGVITPKIIAFFQDESDTVPAAVPIHTNQTDDTISLEDHDTRQPFTDISIAAESAYVWDVRNQRALYKKNEQKTLPLASVTKLMTALVAHELLTEKTKVAIAADAVRQYGNSGLLEGEVFGRQTLSDLMLMSSSNDGAYALAAAAGETLDEQNSAHAFVYAMNIRAEELGLHNTSFKNPTGLDTSETESGADGSAKDVAFLMEYIIENEPDILEFTTEEQARVYSESGIYHDAENTNYYVDKIPGLIGSKTGYTDLAGGNLVVAFNAGLNRPIIISVLGSTRHERFTDVVRLVEETQHYITQE